MFEYFYHEILRKTVVSFGSLFNNIFIEKRNDNGEVFSTIKVPLAYGPTQKFLARLEQSPNLNKPIQITLPRMSFEMIGITYDATRKVTTTQTFISQPKDDTKNITTTYMPVPYNIEFELAIMTKLNDDMLQIIEQILPYFQPSYTMSVDLIDSIGEKRDTPVVLNNISMQDDYEGDFSTRRVLIYTLRFTTKTYLFGPVNTNVSKDIIKKVTIGFAAGGTNSYARGLTYSVTPVATKNYTGTSSITLKQDINSEIKVFQVSAAESLPVGTYFSIDDETFLVKSVSLNPDVHLDDTITVERSQYNTSSQPHVSGSTLYVINQQDHNLIETGDDFGFSEQYL